MLVKNSSTSIELPLLTTQAKFKILNALSLIE